MRLLFAITVSSFCALLWVALALARHIRRSQVVVVRPPQPLATRRSASRSAARPAAREFFEAGEFRTPRPMTLSQEIHQQRPRRALAEIASAAGFRRETAPSNQPAFASQASLHSLPQVEPQPVASPPHVPHAPASHVVFNKETGRITRIDSHPRPILGPIAPAATTSNDVSLTSVPPASLPVEFTGHRIPPSPDRASGLRRRVDLSHYTKDMGDLTDPSYNHALRGSGTQGRVPPDRDH